LLNDVGVARQKEYPKNHSILGTWSSESFHLCIGLTGWAFDPACNCTPVEEWAGAVRAAPGWALAAAMGAMLGMADSFCFTFGVTVPSACSIGTITKANANVHKNRTADVIIASRLHQSENWPENLRFASTKLVCDFFLKQFFMEKAY
jgi:hypothetical protein